MTLSQMKRLVIPMTRRDVALRLRQAAYEPRASRTARLTLALHRSPDRTAHSALLSPLLSDLDSEQLTLSIYRIVSHCSFTPTHRDLDMKFFLNPPSLKSSGCSPSGIPTVEVKILSRLINHVNC